MPDESAKLGNTALNWGGEDLTLDSKLRLLMAKRFRDLLGETFALAQHSNASLLAIPHVEWDEMIRRIHAASPYNPARQTLQRLFLGMSEDDVSFDKQGRFVVPVRLRNAVGLKENSAVTVVLTPNWVEIWDRDKYLEATIDPEAYAHTDKRFAAWQKCWEQLEALR